MQSSSVEFSEIYFKGWGYEDWLVNNGLYCGKILNFVTGCQCSWHYHRIKDETFYLLSGKLHVLYSWDDDIKTCNLVTLEPGMTFHVPVGLRHRMIAQTDAQLIEISTQHFEDDSIRIIPGD